MRIRAIGPLGGGQRWREEVVEAWPAPRQALGGRGLDIEGVGRHCCRASCGLEILTYTGRGYEGELLGGRRRLSALANAGGGLSLICVVPR